LKLIIIGSAVLYKCVHTLWLARHCIF